MTQKLIRFITMKEGKKLIAAEKDKNFKLGRCGFNKTLCCWFYFNGSKTLDAFA